MVKAEDQSSEAFQKLVSIDQIGEKVANDLVTYFNSDLIKIFLKNSNKH